MRKVINKQTGKTEFQFNATLLRLSETAIPNSNGKLFKLADIEFADVNGVISKGTAMVYQGNYDKGLTIGNEYGCTARKGDNGQIYIQMSHFAFGAGYATEDMFGSFEEESTAKPAPQVVAVHPKELAS